MSKTSLFPKNHIEKKRDYNWFATTKSSRARAFYIKTHVINSLYSLPTEEKVKKPAKPEDNTLKFISYSLRRFRQTAKHCKDGPNEKIQPLYYLPPTSLPPIHYSLSLPQHKKRILYPTPRRGPITDREWRELRLCRYLRPGLPKYTQEVDIINDENVRLVKLPILKKLQSKKGSNFFNLAKK